MEPVNHDAANGLWFTKDGVGFAIGNEEYAPALYLSRFSKKLVGHYPAIAEWANANPTEFNARDYLLYWFDELGAQFIAQGWHLLWRGRLFSKCDIEQVRADLAQIDGDTKAGMSQWPSSLRISVHRDFGDEEIVHMSWASLNPEFDSPPLLEHCADSTPTKGQSDMKSQSTVRTYTLQDCTFTVPDGSRNIVAARPLAVTVGTQALEPDTRNGKTLIRFELCDTSALLENAPKLRLKIHRNGNAAGDAQPSIVIEDAHSVELLFDNTSFMSQAKEMPAWLVEGLEFAAKMLRAQYELNQQHVVVEKVE